MGLKSSLQAYVAAHSEPASPAAATSAAAPGVVPNAAEVSRVFSDDTRREIYRINQTGIIEQAFDHDDIVSALIYVCSGVTNGVLQPAAGPAYIGRTSQHLTEVRNIGDENVPVLIPETTRSERQSARIFVNGTAGDQLILIYR